MKTGQGVLENLLETEEFEDGEIDRRVKSESSLVYRSVSSSVAIHSAMRGEDVQGPRVEENCQGSKCQLSNSVGWRRARLTWTRYPRLTWQSPYEITNDRSERVVPRTGETKAHLVVFPDDSELSERAKSAWSTQAERRGGV